MASGRTKEVLISTEHDIQAHLPVTETTFFILLSLVPAPLHGYAIMKRVRSLSEGRITLSTGTLYGALKRLLGQAWIERVDKAEPAEIGRPRKTYALTPLGRRILAAEIERLKGLVRAASLRRAEGRV